MRMVIGKQYSKLRKYIYDAAKLRLEIIPFEEDQRLDNAGWTTYYAIDTNIIHLYLSPDEIGPKGRNGKGGYGHIFHSDDKATSAALGDAFSRYIFQRLTPEDQPVILLRGHEVEARYLYNNLAQRLTDEDEKVKKEEESLADILYQMDAITGQQQKIEFLFTAVPTIVSFLFRKNSATAEFRKYTELLRHKKMMRLGAFIDMLSSNTKAPKQLNKDSVSEVLKGPRTIYDMFEESQLRANWQTRLSINASSIRKSVSSIERDAAALARLEFINTKLKKYKVRMVLISGDNWMCKNANAYFANNENVSFGEPSARREYVCLYAKCVFRT